MEPQEPVRPAFDKAADRQAAWRKQQEAALNDQQKNEYDRMRRDHEMKLRLDEEKFHERLPELFAEEKRRLLLEKPEPALRMLPGRLLKEKWAEQQARGNVEARYEGERKSEEEKFQRKGDDYLRQAERDRLAPDLSAVFRERAQQRERGLDRDRGRERDR